jgi:hypothetical protein
MERSEAVKRLELLGRLLHGVPLDLAAPKGACAKGWAFEYKPGPLSAETLQRKTLILYSTSLYSLKETRFSRLDALPHAPFSFRHHCCLRSNNERVLCNIHCALQG